ncbi:hybrid sensor histidine kinase/response regulator [Chitinophaga lutea]|uniref:histidine kinase n=1 Tax=Chitinophaga lutea TaxID=2488634 RepID=A0A3N4PUM6_9BACT|nr:hybrid sensor histidine kinase/response regulator [Chitinophaga lutea]
MVLTVGRSHGQQVSFSRLTVDQGLVDNSVLVITQDDAGFIWMGTKNGLSRYDGVRFKTYQADPKDSFTINSNQISALYCDSRKTLWVGTDKGLNRYDPNTGGFVRVPLPDHQPVFVHCVFEDSRHDLWFGTRRGLFRMEKGDPRKITQVEMKSETDSTGRSVLDLCEDKQGGLWAGTWNGLARLQRYNGGFKTTVFKHHPDNPASLSANQVRAVAVDHDGRIWVGTFTQGLNRYDPRTGKFERITTDGRKPFSVVHGAIRELIVDRAGMLWAGTQDGLSRIDPATGATAVMRHSTDDPGSLSQNSVYSIFEDKNGSLWAGTYFGGVNIAYAYKTAWGILQSHEHRPGLNNNVVSCIVESKDKRGWWIGTEGGGLNYVDRSTGAWKVFRHAPDVPGTLGSNLIKNVMTDSKGNMWVLTSRGGLNLYNERTGRFRRYDFGATEAVTLETIALAEDSTGCYWLASSWGLMIFRMRGDSMERPPVTAYETGKKINVFTSTVMKDSRGTIWIGSDAGLYRERDGKVWKVSGEHSISAIHEDAEGNIWAGESNRGLLKYEPAQQHTQRFGTKEGLPANINILSIRADDQGYLWLATQKGLVKFHPEKKESRHYTTADGLPGNEFNPGAAMRDSKGTLAFGGTNGLVYFEPGQVETNTYKAPVAFTGLRLFNRPVHVGQRNGLLKKDIALTKTLVFKHSQNVFTIEFALLNFVKSSKNLYRYKLEGFDENWNEVSTPSATYMNLASGRYRFLVKGANNDGIWGQPSVIDIRILPPLWLTWWAYCLYAMVVLAVIFLVSRFIILRTLLKKEDELHKVKLNFFTNVSHEIRTHLTLIMTPIERLFYAKQTDEHTRMQLGTVKQHASRLLKLVSELMDFRKAETQHLKLEVAEHDLIAFLQGIYESFRELSLAKNIAISFSHKEAALPLYFDQEQMEKVFFNLLVNAFKFTPEGGRIAVTVLKGRQEVTVQVSDNGRGIAEEYHDKLFTNFFQVDDHGLQNTGYGIGLALARHIVELHNGKILVQSEPAKNGQEGRTTFSVTLLAGTAHFDQHARLRRPLQAVPAATAGNGSPAAQGTLENEKRFTLLVADDNQDLREQVADMFADRYNILQAPDGEAAWKTATTQIPDLIISDVMMPGTDGFELTNRLKSDERTSHIPVILLTAKSAQADQVSGLGKGADVYITKPFSTEVLQLQVRNLLAARERIRRILHRQITSVTPEKIDFTDSQDQAFLEKMHAVVEEHIDNSDFDVETLAKNLGMSPPVLYKKVKAVAGMSVNDFVKTYRLKRAAQMLEKGGFTVYEVAYSVGFANRRYFSQEFKKQFGKTPREFAGGKEEEEE